MCLFIKFAVCDWFSTSGVSKVEFNTLTLRRSVLTILGHASSNHVHWLALCIYACKIRNPREFLKEL